MHITLTGETHLHTSPGCLLTVKADNRSLSLDLPEFEIDGRIVGRKMRFDSIIKSVPLPNGGTEYHLKYTEDLFSLITELRVYPRMPVFRFRYLLYHASGARLTKSAGTDAIRYTAFSLPKDAACKEIQFSQFDPMVHSYAPLEADICPPARAVGPIIMATDGEVSCLLAYEHGAQYPDGYLNFCIDDTFSLHASRGNYYAGQIVGPDQPFISCFFEFGLTAGGYSALYPVYREFMNRCICHYSAPRKPYIYYNTWNNQERNRNFRNKPYLHTMDEVHMLEEIDIAHKIGVDVFVIDAGWYEKTGDWIINPRRFPNGMKLIRDRINQYGMKLGVWLNPSAAAHTSEMVVNHPEYLLTWDGESHELGKIWETEESVEMCLASGYEDLIVDRMRWLHREYGVTYFKWDGVNEQRCNSPLHDHGGYDNTPEERADCCGYQEILRLIRMVERVAEVCPEIIVDFDVTESNRCFGLGFLSVGRYFLVNNGPYSKDFDMPVDFKIHSLDHKVELDPWTNIFWYPGAMRSRVCRQPVRFDHLVPNSAFLVHYLPDPPRFSQENALACIFIAGGGIWGDLAALSQEDQSLFSERISPQNAIKKEHYTPKYIYIVV